MRKTRTLLFTVLLCSTVPAAQTNYDTSPEAQTGVQPYGSYFSADIDNI